MGKLLFFAIIGLAAYYIWWRGAGIRKREIADDEARGAGTETLVYDPKKRAYVPGKPKK